MLPKSAERSPLGPDKSGTGPFFYNESSPKFPLSGMTKKKPQKPGAGGTLSLRGWFIQF
jgi:hypothetical protein